MAQVDNCLLVLPEKKGSGAISGLLVFLSTVPLVPVKACQERKVVLIYHTHGLMQEFHSFQ